MLHIICRNNIENHSALVENMFRDRKTVFVDFLKWDLQHDGELEKDQFDNERAIYIVIEGDTGEHLASVRLLPSKEDHILGSVFPHLCENGVPRSPDIFEITRLCQKPSLRGDEARIVRQRIASALVEYALAVGIKKYTGVTPMDFLSRLLVNGWVCNPLGLPQSDGETMIGAFEIIIDETTETLMRQAGNWRNSGLTSSQAIQSKAA